MVQEWQNKGHFSWLHSSQPMSHVAVQSLSCIWLFATPLTAACQASQIPVHWVGDANQPSLSLLLPSPLALNLFQHQELFQWVSSSHLVAKVMELWLQLPMNIQGWFPLGLTALIYLPSKTLSSCLLQHQNSKASILQCSAFLLVQLSYPYRTNGKKHSLHYKKFVGKVMSLLFNTLFRFFIALLPRNRSFQIRGCSQRLLWFWSPRK